MEDLEQNLLTDHDKWTVNELRIECLISTEFRKSATILRRNICVRFLRIE